MSKTAVEMLNQIKADIEAGFDDAAKHDKGVAAATTRVRTMARNVSAQLKALSHEVQDQKHARQAQKAAK